MAIAAGLVTPSLAPPAVANMTQAPTTTGRETFDAASIRENQSAPMGRPMIREGPSGLSATNATALDLIQHAFGILGRDVVGELPDWVRSTKFDVVARAASGPLTRSRLLSMAKALLEDRFRLNASFERAERPVYALVMARSDGSKGPELRSSQSKCQVDLPLRGSDVPQSLNISEKCGFGSMRSGDSLDAVFGTRVTMEELASYLSRVGGFDRPVVNRTGLSGEFDLMARPTPDMQGPSSEARFLTALREQLGLAVRDDRGSVDVLRIRNIEHPSEN